MRHVRPTILLCLVAMVSAGRALADSGPAHQVKQTPPVKMGTSGGSANDATRLYCCGGTLGSLVLYDGQLHILSNNHILARSGSASAGEDTIQPGLIDTACRTTSVNIVADFIGNRVPLGSANVDAALSLARAGMVDTSGAILDVGVPCSAIQAPTIGLAVMKSGRTSGLTTGTIQTVNATVSIQYQKGCGSGKKFVITYTNQIGTTNMSASGDSGSLLVSNDGTPNPVGLLYAGSSSATFYNPAQAVANAFTAGGHTFSFVGNSCGALTSTEGGAAPAAIAVGAIPADVVDRVTQIKSRNEHNLFRIPGVLGVGVGATEANPQEPAVVIYLESPNGEVPRALPHAVEDVKVRVIFTDPIIAQ